MPLKATFFVQPAQISTSWTGKLYSKNAGCSQARCGGERVVTEVKRHQGSWPLTHRPRTYIGVGDRKDDTANYAVEDWSWLVQPPTQLFAILDQDKTSRLQQYIR